MNVCAHAYLNADGSFSWKLTSEVSFCAFTQRGLCECNALYCRLAVWAELEGQWTMFLITEVTGSHEIESGTGACKNGKNVLRFCCLHCGLHSKPRFQSQLPQWSYLVYTPGEWCVASRPLVISSEPFRILILCCLERVGDCSCDLCVVFPTSPTSGWLGSKHKLTNQPLVGFLSAFGLSSCFGIGLFLG